ncbi:MAG: DegT/DnrJ/EryC1/StrS aminotransferase family protein [Deltaproteobacteria bacterium]|nr:DegT/DnrJ/EryC1/StrS aminotransferase family protein [Deltaproteobacteria bacterium]
MHIPHNRPCLDESDAAAAYQAVLSGWVSHGRRCRELEEALSQLILHRPGGGLVCANGTTALYLAMKVVGVSKGDEVVVPGYCCTALLNAVFMAGARPVVADISPGNLSFNRDSLSPYLTPVTKAVVVVHTYGIPCEVDKLAESGVSIIEDCAQALGSRFKDGQPVGSKGDVAAFSFYATKFITGGYGGAIISRNTQYINQLTDYLNFDQPSQYYPRFNFQVSDINAAVILSQLQKLDRFLDRRRQIARRYLEVFDQAQFNRLAGQNHFRFLVELESKEQINHLRSFLADKGINAIIPLEEDELLHNYLALSQDGFPVAQRYAKTLLSLPIYPCLTDEQVAYICQALAEWRYP